MTNSDKKYLLYNSRDWYFPAQIIVSIVLMLLIISKVKPIPFLEFMIAFVVIHLIIWIIIKYLLLQPIQVSLLPGEIKLTYLTRDLQQTQKQRIIRLSNIQYYSEFEFRSDHSFKLESNQGRSFTLYSSFVYHRKDDFEEFVNDCKIHFKNWNKTIDNPVQSESKIKQNNTYYESVAISCWVFSIIPLLATVDSLVENRFDLKVFLLFIFLLMCGFVLYKKHLTQKNIN